MDEKAANDLVPLELAVLKIYVLAFEAHHRKAGLICGPEQLNGIAHAIAALVPVFTYDKDPGSVRILSEQELQKGAFKEGGRVMIFLDSRAPIRTLAVSAGALHRVARELSASARSAPDP
jgi:hypothetical protein